jgi:hypothetical protein
MEDIVTFQGVVEDIKDPLGTGHVRVRVIGTHSENVQEIPTDKLPWAMVEVAAGMAHLFSGPKNGDWVTGYYRKNKAGVIDTERPIVSSVIVSGIRSVEIRQPTNSNAIIKAVNGRLNLENRNLEKLETQWQAAAVNPSLNNLKNIARLSLQINLKRSTVGNLRQLSTDLDTRNNQRLQQGFVDSRPQAEINLGPRIPGSYRGTQDIRSDYPVLPSYARGIVQNTGIAYSNRNRAHVCDVAIKVRKALGGSEIARQVAHLIREGLQRAFALLGVSPFSAYIADKIRYAAAQIKKITTLLKRINKMIAYGIQQINLLKAIVQFILNLPTYLKKLLDRCIREAFYEIAIFLYELISEALPADTLNAGLGDTFQAIGDLVTSTSALLTEAQRTEALVQEFQNAADFELKQNKDGTFSFAKPSGYTDTETEAIFEREFPGTSASFKENKVIGSIL